MNASAVEPIIGKRVLFPPGHVAIRLDERHRRAYRRLYGLFFPLADAPTLKDDAFDGRSIHVTRTQLAALNRLFATLDRSATPRRRDAFGGQEESLIHQFREMQFLS